MHKAQDTVYGGILYRRKLEASWAEFFDKNQIKHKFDYALILTHSSTDETVRFVREVVPLVVVHIKLNRKNYKAFQKY